MLPRRTWSPPKDKKDLATIPGNFAYVLKQNIDKLQTIQNVDELVSEAIALARATRGAGFSDAHYHAFVNGVNEKKEQGYKGFRGAMAVIAFLFDWILASDPATKVIGTGGKPGGEERAAPKKGFGGGPKGTPGPAIPQKTMGPRVSRDTFGGAHVESINRLEIAPAGCEIEAIASLLDEDIEMTPDQKEIIRMAEKAGFRVRRINSV